MFLKDCPYIGLITNGQSVRHSQMFWNCGHRHYIKAEPLKEINQGKMSFALSKTRTRVYKKRVRPIHVVASKCSRNHFICEKYKTVHSIRLRFLRNSFLGQIHTSISNSKGVENFAGNHIVKAFSALPSHS